MFFEMKLLLYEMFSEKSNFCNNLLVEDMATILGVRQRTVGCRGQPVDSEDNYPDDNKTNETG